MNIAHTSGPWSVDPNHYCDVQSSDGLEIATTAGRVLIGGIKPTFDAQRANARLIAAAPELLEMVSDISKAYRAILMADSELTKRASALIAKATGGHA